MSAASINETIITDNTHTDSSVPEVFVSSTVSSSASSSVSSTAVAPNIKQLRAEAAAAVAALSAAEKAMASVSISTPREPKSRPAWTTPRAPQKPPRRDDASTTPPQPVVYALPPGYTAIAPDDYTTVSHTRRAAGPPIRYAAGPPTQYADPPTQYAEPPSRYAPGPPPTHYAGPPPTHYAGPPPTHYAEPPRYAPGPPPPHYAEPPTRYSAPHTTAYSSGGSGYTSQPPTRYAAESDPSLQHSLSNYPVLKRQSSESRHIHYPPAPLSSPYAQTNYVHSKPAQPERMYHHEPSHPREPAPPREPTHAPPRDPAPTHTHAHEPNAYQKGLKTAQDMTLRDCKRLFTPTLCEQINTELTSMHDGEKPYSKAIWTKFKDVDGKVVIITDGETHAYVRTRCMLTKEFRDTMRAFVATIIPDGWLNINFWDDTKEEKYCHGEVGFGFYIKRRS